MVSMHCDGYARRLVSLFGYSPNEHLGGFLYCRTFPSRNLPKASPFNLDVVLGLSNWRTCGPGGEDLLFLPPIFRI